ncbi:MAG: FG-GAP-like repeat-containing protein [bacterium]
MKSLVIGLIFGTTLLSLSRPVPADDRVWLVPVDAPTIQAGLDSAVSGDQVLVVCGTYLEHDIILQSGVFLSSLTSDPDCVTVDAQGQGPVFRGVNLTPGTFISGFTITGGQASGTEPANRGGGMSARDANLIISSCRFLSNEAEFGGGMYSDGSSLTLLNCEFVTNQSDQDGGGLLCESATLLISGCLFSDNRAGNNGGGICLGDTTRASLYTSDFLSNFAELSGGGVALSDSAHVALGCVFSGNQTFLLDGGGLTGGDVSVQYCLFNGNRAGLLASGGAVSCQAADILGSTFWANESQLGTGSVLRIASGGSSTLQNSILAANNSAVIHFIGDDTAQVSGCNIHGNDGGDWVGGLAGQGGTGGNLSADPLFCDAGQEIFTLALDSPCNPANNPEVGLVGAYQVGCVATNAFAWLISSSLQDARYGAGTAWVDYDGDTRIDLFVANENGGTVALYRNEGGNIFSDITPGSGMQSAAGFAAVAWGDYDNDGDPDCFLTSPTAGVANVLYRNDGGGLFSDATDPPLNDDRDGRTAAAWIDYDNDGWLDLYLGSLTRENLLLHNNGDLTFSDVATGLVGDSGPTRTFAWGDFDNDGDADVYLSRDGEANLLLRNDGAGVFSDATAPPLDDPGAGRGVAWGDYDNDGDLDLYLANYDGANKLFRNDGGAVFSDATTGDLGDDSAGRSGTWGDFDNDGFLDLLLTNDGGGNRLLRNLGDGSFADLTPPVMADSAANFGAGWGDADNDGYLDCYLSRQGTPNRLLRNTLPRAHRWLRLVVTGTIGNGSGIGARIRIVADGRTQIREVGANNGLYSQNAPVVMFGLNSSSHVDTLQITWPRTAFPSSRTETLTHVTANQTLQLIEPLQPGVGVPSPDLVPAAFRLHPCQPNPFNPATTLRFDLPATGRVQLSIHDVAGRLVRTLIANEVRPSGHHVTGWDGRDRSGTAAASGLYFCRLTVGSFHATERLVLVK